jgi:hypothetical protein
LGNPWGFEELTRAQKLDMLAYWQIQKKPSEARWLLSSPATMRDLYDILLTHHGKAPRSLFSGGKKSTIDPQVKKAWANTTGSDAGAVDWWAAG